MDDIALPDSAPTSRGLAAGSRVFARFTLVRWLGRGGMGVVWLAQDEALDCAVALKFLPDAVRWDPAALAALRRETRRSRELTHPHIVRVHDIHEEAGAAAIAMEYLPGGSLHQLRAARTPPILECEEIAVWLPGLCAALDHAHAQGVVHRDLKPANLLVAADGAVKISDFGIAQPLFETALRLSQWAPSGTLAYMSPQQQFGEPATASDDLYALGATLYELLTGKPPFYAGNLAAQIEHRRPDSLAARRGQLGVSGEAVPRSWEETIAACLAKRAEERPRTAAEIAAHIASCAARTVRRPARPAARPWLLGALALTLGFALWRGWPPAAAVPAVPSVAAPAFASDTTRALAAWNLDGDGEEGSGRRWELRGIRVVPAPDRHGRIGRALAFNGSAGLDLPAPPELRWERAQAFSVALWVRPVGEGGVNGMLAMQQAEHVGATVWDLALVAGRVKFSVRAAQVDDHDTLLAGPVLASDTWHHVVAVHAGPELRLYVNGRLAGKIARRSGTRGAAPGTATLLFGSGGSFDPHKFVGALDEVRLWRRTLSEVEIALLADPAPPPRFALTRGTYVETIDLPAAAGREFGPAARLTDWTELRRWHAHDTRAWLDELGISANGDSVYVQREGGRFAEKSRHYFLARFDGTKPDYFLVHDELGGMTLALGSWHGLNMRALTVRPFAAPERVQLVGGGVAGVRREFASEERPTAGAVAWSQEFRPQNAAAGPSVAEAALELRDGRRLRARCTAKGGNFTLTLGDAERPQRIRELGVSYERIEFTLAWRAGRLEWRAVSLESGVPLFQERVALADFVPEAVAAVRVPGVDSAELTIEH